MSSFYPNAGMPYTDEEIEQLLLESLKEGARRRANLERLSKDYGRSPLGIDMVIRWCQEADFPERANNRIRRQVMAAKARLGIE